MELKEGMYVRTKYGIARYVHKAVTKATIYYVVDKKIVYDNVEGWEDSLLSNEILKASYNIIDLIEIGDYVNGLPVCINYWKSDNKWHLEIPDSRFISKIPLEQVNIQSIVTKEQFESMQYRLGD